ncbi:MAG: TolC family protein [bacterium]
MRVHEKEELRRMGNHRTGKWGILFLSSLLCLISFPGWARAKSLTLEEAIRLALANNREILVAKEKIEEARQRVKEAKAGYFPTINLGGTYTRLNEPPSMSIPGYGSVGMGKTDNYLSKLSFSQPLYTTGRLGYANKQADLGYQKAQEDLKNTQNNITFQVKKAFYAVLLAQENVEVTEKALDQAKRHLAVVEGFLKVGVVSKFDLLRTRVEVANLKPDLVQARNNLRLSQESLANLLSLPSVFLKLEGGLSFEPLKITLEEAIDKALKERSDLKSLRLQKEALKVALKLAEVQNKPTLALAGNYQYQKPSGGENEWGEEWNLNLVLSIPFFDGWASQARVAQRRSQVKQIDLSLQHLEAGIDLEVKKAFWDLEASEGRIYAQEKNIELSEEALSIAEVRYQSGAITNLEVLDAQLALTRARLGYLKALYDHNVAMAELEKAMK